MTELSELAPRELRADDNEAIGGDGKTDDRNLSKKLKNAKSGCQMWIEAIEKPIFLTSGTKKIFKQLKEVITKVLIFWHFNLEYHIQIEINTSGYAIGGVLTQLISDHLTSNQSQWYLVAYFFIPVEIRGEIHNGDLLAIVEAFKIWRYYPKGCKH